MVVVGLDYGRSRTGTAIFLEGIVLPGEPVRGDWKSIARRLADLRERYGMIQVVLGLPLSALGKPTELSMEVERLAEHLEEIGYAVSTVRETGSTCQAISILGRTDRKGHVDSVAACEILKRHLNIL